MIVCQCKGTTDRDIRKTMMRGARTCDDIGRACGAGTGCGGCIPTVEFLLDPKSARAAKAARKTNAA